MENNNDPLGMQEKLANMSDRPMHRTASNRTGLLVAAGIALLVAAVGIAACKNTLGKSEPTEAEKLQAKNLELTQRLYALMEKIETERQIKAVEAPRPQPTVQPVPVATPPKAQPTIAPTKTVTTKVVPTVNGPKVVSTTSTHGVLIGTLYHKSKRAQFKEEVASALAGWANDGENIRVCFLEVGDTKHARFETSAVAVGEEGLTQSRAAGLNTCLHDKLPMINKVVGGQVEKDEEGKPVKLKVATEVVDTDAGRYKDKGCLWE